MRLSQFTILVLLLGGCAFRSPSPPPPPSPSDLGSPPEAAAAFSTDYRALVSAALPRVTGDELGQRLRRVRSEAAAAKPLRVQDAGAWGALFGRKIDARPPEQADELVDSGDASYQVDPDVGRFYVSIRYPDVAPVPRQEFKQLLPEIRRAHQALAEKIGIPEQEIFFVDFRETLVQSTPRPGMADARESPIESAGATTTLLRSVGGLLVDGSFVRLSSQNVQQLEMADVRWPPVRLLPEVETQRTLPPARLAERIVDRISSSAQGKAVNVLMAVVLRPVHTHDRIYFVPSLRVGVSPRSERASDGYQTDAGEEMYFDLIAGMESLGDRDERDSAESLGRQAVQ